MRLLPASQHPFSSRTYAEGFAPFAPFEIKAWGVHLLQRPLPDAEGFDLTGCYPLTNLGNLDHAALRAGLEEAAMRGAVSLSFVLDPWNAPDQAVLDDVFTIARPFKTHLAYDRLAGPINYTRRHWREVRQARQSLVFRTVDPAAHVDAMTDLYRNLVDAKHLEGPSAFDHAFFDKLMSMSEVRLVLAYLDDVVVGSMTFVVAGDVCYAHLAGTTDLGRRHCAHYGCYAEALESYTDCQIIHLGGAPGFKDDPDDPILYVKRKFANTEMTSVLCGAVLADERYRALTGPESDTSYFPAYRTSKEHKSPPPKLDHAEGD